GVVGLDGVGEVFQLDLRAAGQDDGALNSVFKLADVAGPVVTLHGGEGEVGESEHFAAGLVGELAEEVIGEEGDVGEALAQAGEAELISSRRRVPPSALINLPGLSAWAPVKAPRVWPKSSDSRRVSGRAPQETSTKGLSRRGERWWIARARSDLPVPDSPVISTVVRLSATASTRSQTLSSL